jgi:hypothetical protein
MASERNRAEHDAHTMALPYSPRSDSDAGREQPPILSESFFAARRAPFRRVPFSVPINKATFIFLTSPPTNVKAEALQTRASPPDG